MKEFTKTAEWGYISCGEKYCVGKRKSSQAELVKPGGTNPAKIGRGLGNSPTDYKGGKRGSPDWFADRERGRDGVTHWVTEEITTKSRGILTLSGHSGSARTMHRIFEKGRRKGLSPLLRLKRSANS